jgi:beta-glucosidase
MRRRRITTLGLSLVALAAPLTVGSISLSSTSIGATAAGAASCGPWMNADQTAAARTSELVSAMTLTQKLSLVHQQLGDIVDYGAAGYVPGIPGLCIPPLVLNDAGSGLADEQLGITSYPAEIDQAATWDPSLERQLGVSLGAEAHAKGVDVLLAPDLNLTRTPLGGRDSEEMGEDPYLTSEMGDAFIEGVQSQHVIASAKQYVGNDQEVNRASIDEIIDPRTLKELYEAPFDSAVTQANVGSVMCAYNKVNGAFNCQNPSLLFGNLEGTDGFQGFIVSDWGATHATAASADAGLDLEMGVAQIPNALEPLTGPSLSAGSEEVAEDWFGAPLAAAVKEGQVSLNVLNNMVSRILHSMFAVGVFDDPASPLPGAVVKHVDTPANQSAALATAEAGTVLLQNKDDVLPLTGSDKKIAVIGLDASAGAALVDQAGGSVRTLASLVVTPLNAITKRAAQAGDSVAYDSGLSTAAAAAVAKTANVAIVYAGYTEGEGSDLPNLDYNNAYCELKCVTLASNANALISAVAAANPHTIVVLNTGGPALMPWLNQVQGVVEAWYPGEEDGNSAAAILFGDVDPSGKLPVTFPTSIAQTPTQTAAQYPGIDGTMTYAEGLLIGYRWYDAKDLTPLFPFGFGLSYTTFGFSGLSINQAGSGVQVSASLTNTGDRNGADVVQVYVGDPASTGEPPQQLEASAKESLAAGGQTQVSFTLPARAFSYWDTTDSQWVVASGCYSIAVGDSSANEPLQGQVALGGGQCP